MEQLKKIFETTKEIKRYYVGIGALTIVASLLNLLLPAVTGRVIDLFGQENGFDIGLAIFYAGLIFGADFLYNVINNISGYIGDQMGMRVRRILGLNYYRKLTVLPQNYFDNETTGKIVNRLERSVNQVADFLQAFSNNFLQFVFSTVFALIVVATYSWEVAVFLALLYPIYIFLTTKNSGLWLEYQNKINHHNDLASGRFNEAVSQIRAVKSFSQEDRELKYYTKQLNRIIQYIKPQSRHWHTSDFKRRLVLNVIFFAVYCFIFVQGARGQLSAGDAVALILYSNQIRIPIFTISFLVDRTQRVISNSKDYFDVMEKVDEEKRPGAANLHVHDGSISFKDVSFSYDNENKVLKNLNFDIRPGEKVALVGESGGGKTTVTNLLMGFYQPNSGSIQIDEQDISNVSLPSLRRSIGAVFQTASLFSGTIKENIGYSKHRYKDADIITAAKAANAHQFIKDFKEGYDSFIGERGLKLSGGQKQRVSIARALFKDGPILVLDEATSSLDSKSEILVQAALNKLMENRTTIIIAHRLSTIANVDKILVIDGGQIAEQGTPKQLAKSGGIYSQLLKLQKDGADLEELKKYDMVG